MLIILFVLLNILSSAELSLTLDEPLHLHYGLFILQGNSDRIDDSSMPVSAMNALPLYLSARVPPGFLKVALERIFLARLVTVLMAAGFIVVIFRWAYALYGDVAAVLAALLYIFDPNVLANSQLVTTDVLAAGMMTWALYRTWLFSGNRTMVNAVAATLVIALSQLVKYTAVVLVPLCVMVVLIHDLPAILGWFRARAYASLTRYAVRFVGSVVIAAAVTGLIVNAGFLFNRTLLPLGEYRFRSGFFRDIQSQMGSMGTLPVPLPYPYLEGLDWMVHTEQTANRYGNIYLLGHLSKPLGFPGYYVVASALKVPIATQFIIAASILLLLTDAVRRRRFLRNELFFLLPAVLLGIYLNFFFDAQTGMRYYLVVLLPLYVFAGSLFMNWSNLTAWKRIAGLALVGYLAISVLSYFPHFTPYFNEFVPDKTLTYKYLADTNLDWGQSSDDLERYLASYPDAVYEPEGVQAGHLVIGGSDLVGILEDPGRYEWLRENFEPVDTVAYSYFVYRISPQEVAELCSSTDYCN